MFPYFFKLLEIALPPVSCVCTLEFGRKKKHLTAYSNQVLTFVVLSYCWSQLLVFLEALAIRLLESIIRLVSIV